MLLLLIMLVCIAVSQSEAQDLSTNFYSNSCPNALSTIRRSINTAISRERRMAASLLRLHFHDCFVQGCDASILLDQSPTIQTEKAAPPNEKSVRGYEVIDAAKAQVERICPGVVSCADILAVAARDASAYVGGPSWNVKLGRRDSTSAFPDLALTDLPFFKEDLQTLIDRFQGKGLSPRDMVALSGAHTLGQAQCFTFRDRIYSNGTDIDAGFASTRRRRCPVEGGDTNLAPLDLVTPNSFDNNYFRDLVQRKGLLVTDQVLFNGGSTDSIVVEYSRNRARFNADFAVAMIKMGDIQPLMGSAGQIRRICGSHTIGQARCVTFRGRIYGNAYDIDANFASTRRRQCPSAAGNGDGNLAAMDLVTPNSFDNNYFRNLMQRRGLLQSDQVLFSGGSTDGIVQEYSRNPRLFTSDFAAAMVRMGDIEPLTGTRGEIRRVCTVVNAA
ncbi:Lignin-forming anionic peroxidase [Linum perenne]